MSVRLKMKRGGSCESDEHRLRIGRILRATPRQRSWPSAELVEMLDLEVDECKVQMSKSVRRPKGDC